MSRTLHPAAHIWGEALYQIAAEKGIVADLEEELFGIAGLIDQHRPLRILLETPSVNRMEKKGFIERVFGGNVSPATFDFLRVLADHGRLTLLCDIAQAYRREVDERTSRHRIAVTTAVALDDETRQRLAAQLREAFGSDVIVEEKVRERIVGGVVFSKGDMQVDASVARQLRRIKTGFLDKVLSG